MAAKWTEGMKLALTIGIALMGLAASWGAAKASISTMETDLAAVEDKTRALELSEAGNAPVLKQISEDIKEIKQEIKEIKERLPNE